MNESCKIQINHNQIRKVDDLESFARILFPNNKNQRRTFMLIFLELKWASSLVPNLNYIIEKYGVSKRIFERTRTKLRKMGIIEHVSRFSKKYNYQEGWVLSSRFTNSLHLLSEQYGELKNRRDSEKQKEKDFGQLNFV